MSEAWAIFAAVAAAHALGVASPGPDFAVVLRQTLAHGRRIGMATAIGIGSGIVFHVAWGMFGLSWAVQRYPGLLDTMRWGGAAVLLWMGLRALRSQPSAEPETLDARPAVPSAWRAYLLGLATNLLNPKAFLFFVALCSSVISAGASPWLRLALGAWMTVATAAFFCLVAVTVGRPQFRQSLRAQAHRIDHVMGLILIGLAAAAAIGF